MATKTKRVRWECPNGLHPGVLGPSRPRKDDVCRYCLECSQRVGRLVHRTAPALERQRQEKATRAQERRQTKQQRAKEQETALYTVGEVDLREEMKRLLRLPIFREKPTYPDIRKHPPTLTVRPRTSYPRSQLGYCEAGGSAISVNTWPGITQEDACDTLAHELAHAFCERINNNPDGRTGQKWHGTYWRSVFRSILRQGYDIEAPQVHHAYHRGLLLR